MNRFKDPSQCLSSFVLGLFVHFSSWLFHLGKCLRHEHCLNYTCSSFFKTRRFKVSEYPFKQNKNTPKKIKVLLYTPFYNIYLNVLRPTFFNICNLPFSYFPNTVSGKLGSKLGQRLTTFPTLWAPATTELQYSIFFSLVSSQPRDKQNRARDFLLFKYFLNSLLINILMQNTLSKLVELM